MTRYGTPVLPERALAVWSGGAGGGRERESSVFVDKPSPPPPSPLSLQEKNVAHDTLDGRVGRVYVPPQDLGALPTALAKGVKRGRARGDGGDGRGKKGRAAEE